MKSMRRALTIFFIILAVTLSSAACQRMSKGSRDVINENQDDSKDALQDPSQTKKPEEPEQEGGRGYLVPIAVNSGYNLLYGYAGKNGKTVIEPQYKMAEPFYACGAAIVTDRDGKAGLIDEKGVYLVQPQYDYFSYSEGLFLTHINDGNTTIAYDEKGNKRFEYQGYIYEFHDGLSPNYDENQRGYIDTSGTLALKLGYQDLGQFSNGIAKVAEVYSGPSFYIDTKGNDLTDKRSSGLRMFKDDASGLFGYKDQNANIIIEARYTEAEPFLDGYAIVSGPDSAYSVYGLIDTKGNFVLEPKYCGIQRMENGLFAVGEEAKSDFVPYGYFEYSKKALFTPDLKNHTDWIYYSAANFDKDTVCVNDEESVLFINKDLKQAADLPGFKGQGSFTKDGSLLRGYLNNLTVVADSKGNILTGSNEKIDLGDGITVDMNLKSLQRTTTLSYPVLSGLKDKTVQDSINALIVQEIVTPYEQPSNTEEDPYNITVVDTNVSVMRQKDLLLIDESIYMYSLGAAHPSHFRNTLYIDLKTGAKYVLDDLFKGTEAYAFLSDQVSAEMKAKMEEVGYWEDHVTITPETGFVLTENGLGLYFAEYEIASYAAGMQEFTIPFSDLTPYIDTEGAFWKSFN